MIIGIDPGISGAIAFLGGQTPGTYDMPVAPKLNGKGNAVNAHGVVAILRAAQGESPTVFIEAVGPMPGQGVTSTFSFGRSAGVLEGVLAALNIPFHHVRPQQWKKAAGLTGKDKDAARALALNLFPTLSDHLSRKKDVGRADALLIAYFGSRLMDKAVAHSG